MSAGNENSRIADLNRSYMDKTVLTFTGDIGFDHFMAGKWEDENLIADDVLAYLAASDHVIANVEGPLVDPSSAKLMQAAEMRLMHTIDPAAVSVLHRMNADIWNLCNNHIMDAGQEGLALTLECAKENGAAALGVGMNLDEACRPVYLDEAGGIGMFAVGYRRGCKPAGPDKGGCLNWNETDTIRSIISEIKSKCRWCIVVSHGGEEFTALPTPYTRDRYLEYLDLGADAVICHHPHVPMNYEKVGDKYIFYSLGNFIFDTPYQRSQFYTESGVVLKLIFAEDRYDFEALGVRVDRDAERIASAPLPDIFTEVPEDEYKKLAPLSAKAFVAATKRQQIFMYPDRYSAATTEEEWHENFWNEKRSGRVPGEALDFQIVCPLADEAEKGAWKDSRLEKVKDYILKMM